MRRTTLAGFGISFLVFAPVVWHATEADIPSDGALTRPAQQSFVTRGATVTVALDRGLMNAGDEATVAITATSDSAKDLSLDVTAMKDEGMGDERVPKPPVVVGRRAVIVHAAPGGGPPTEVSFHLGHRGAPGQVSWFDVLVTPARAKKPSHVEYDPNPEDGTPATSADVGVATWTGNSFGLVIEPPAAPPAKGPFEVGVRITNTTKKPIENLYVTLGDSIGTSYNGMEGYVMGSNDAYAVEQIDDAASSDSDPLAPGAERMLRFKITPKDGVHHFTLEAEVQAGGAGGALDVKAFDSAPDGPAPTPVAVQ